MQPGTVFACQVVDLQGSFCHSIIGVERQFFLALTADRQGNLVVICADEISFIP